MDWIFPKPKSQTVNAPVIPSPGESEEEKALARRQRASLFLITGPTGVSDNRKMMGGK